MAREKVFKVVIDGEEYVSKAADAAGAGMDRFTGKKDGWIRSFVDLKAAWDTVVQAGRALAGVALDSLAAFDQYDASMRKLEGTAKITGTPLAVLTDLATTAKREFGLSSVQANDYATAVNNLATKAGYAGSKQELLTAMLDLGAAKGLTAAESLVAFEQSILGIDEGTDKLFGKNPSGLWADFADQIGKAPGKMSDLDKSMVLVFATMEAGGLVQGSYSEWLQSSAGQTALLTNRIDDARVAFGEVLSPIRAVVVEGMNSFLDSMDTGKDTLGQVREALTLVVQNLVGTFLGAWQTVGPAIVLALKGAAAGVMLFTDGLQMLQIVASEVVGWVAQKLGGFAEKTADVMRALGFNVTAEWGTTLRKWGEETDKKASESYDKFRRTSEAAWAAVTGEAQKSAAESGKALDRVAVAAEDSGRRTTKAGVESAKDREKAEKDYAAFVKQAYKENEEAIRALNDLWKIKTESVKIFEKAAKKALSKDKAMEFKVGMQDITTASDAAFQKLLSQGEALDDNLIKQGKYRDIVGDAVDVVKDNILAVGQLGEAFGLVDEEAQAVITSVATLAENLPKALGGDPMAIAASVASLANLLGSVFGGDKERQRLLKNNTEALQRLSRDVGGLKLNITGADFVKAQQALSGVVGQLAGGRGAANETDVRNALFGVGLTMADLEKIGKEFGIELRTKSGALNVDSVKAILEALGTVDLGKLSKNFGDQLDWFRETQNISGVTGTVGGLGGLLQFLRSEGGVTAFDGLDLTNLPGARSFLEEMFIGLKNGDLDASQLGKLTGGELMDLILEFIDSIDALTQSPAGGSAAPPPPATGIDGVDVGAGAAPAPAVTLADIFRGYAGEALPLLTDQLDAQRRIADATETTAANTALTVSELRALRAYFSSGGLTARVNEELARAQDLESLAQGGGVAL